MLKSQCRDWRADTAARLSDTSSDLNSREFVLIRRLICDLLARSAMRIQNVDPSALERCLTALALASSPVQLRTALEALRHVCGETDGHGADVVHPTTHPGPFKVAAALAYIQEHACDHDISLGAVAEHVGLSKWHLSRLLARRGHRFEKVVHNNRVDRAAALLHTSLSVKEIAARVGYSHTNLLDRHFRAVHGVTPTVYRMTYCGCTSQRRS